MPRPIRPWPSISSEPMPRRASCAATIVPEKPPPTMATTRRSAASDVIVGPLLRLGRAGPDFLDIMIGLGDDAAGGVGEPAGNGGMDERRQAGADQLDADPGGAGAMRDPA